MNNAQTLGMIIGRFAAPMLSGLAGPRLSSVPAVQALVCAMNMMWSDHTRIVRKVAVETSMEDEDVCHRLAVDVLKDADGVFDIRRCFHLED